MGIQLKDILICKEINLDALQNKILVFDTYNLLYQFLTTIRGRDGSLLTDSKGQTTSHLVGLFSRTTKLMEHNLRLAFVFDGKVPDLKKKERERRQNLKKEAEAKYQEAVKKEDVDEMRKYAGRTTRLTPDLVEEAKKLISALGLPIIQAPSEGEAQAAYMVKKGDAFASISQDFDSLLHGASKLVRNLSLVGKRKKTNKLAYETIKPEIIDLQENLTNLGLTHDQLIALAVLVGTDYNIGGVKGIGPKNALKLVKKYPKDFDALFIEAKWDDFFDFSWKDVYDVIKNMPTTDKYTLEWKEPDFEAIRKLLVEKHDFSNERVENTLNELNKNKKERQQKGLGEFF